MGDAGLTPHEQAVASDIYDAIDTERAGSITVARLQSHVHEVPLRLLEQNPHLLAEDDQTRPKALGSTPNLSVGKENTLHIKLDGDASREAVIENAAGRAALSRRARATGLGTGKPGSSPKPSARTTLLDSKPKGRPPPPGRRKKSFFQAANEKSCWGLDGKTPELKGRSLSASFSSMSMPSMPSIFGGKSAAASP